MKCADKHMPQLEALGLCNASGDLGRRKTSVDTRAACGTGDDAVPLFLPTKSPMVGYCVEMLDVPYSRYESCNGGAMRDGGTIPVCECQLGGNREQAGESAASMNTRKSKCSVDGYRMSRRWCVASASVPIHLAARWTNCLFAK